MTAKIVMEKGRIALHKENGEVEVRPGQDRMSGDEVKELMAELREDDNASGSEQGC